MRRWNEKTIAWYLRAGESSEYPAKVLAHIMPRLRPRHTVLDIGCGPGLYALAMAPAVGEVLAVDRDAQVLDTLRATAQNRGLDNIRCLNATWPTAIKDEVHVIISALGSGEIMTTQASIAAMLEHEPEAVFLIAPGRYIPPFGTEREANTNSHPDAEDTTRILEQMGIAYSRKDILLDFGQPVEDMDEAVEFLADFLRIAPGAAREHAEKIAQPRGRGVYLPNPRNVVLISL